MLIDKSPRFNLNVVLRETGVKADTLRAWERRYQLPVPQRTEGGHRLFSQYDIETVRWLLARRREGMRISRAVGLFRDLEVQGKDPFSYLSGDPVDSPPVTSSDSQVEILSTMRSRWVRACMDFDEAAAEDVLAQSFARFPVEVACYEILQKGLVDVGDRWYEGTATVQMEHFATELALRRLHTLMAAAPQPVKDQTVLLGCPPGEQHTFSSLLIAMLLRYRGWKVIYLGADVPEEWLAETVRMTHPALVVMTAMRLTSAARLLETALFLQRNRIPLAYGGGAFSTHPGLQERIPGTFLGDTIHEGMKTIEATLAGIPRVTEVVMENTQFAMLHDTLSSKKAAIEAEMMRGLPQSEMHGISLPVLQGVSTYLLDDILAALALGELDLLQGNLAWIKGLLAHRRVPAELLTVYLGVFRDAVQAVLGEDGRVVTDWLGDLIQQGV